ncbi:hypothetical protein [Candidatus Nitrososphaera gargensis]|uniref:hypothetical protein n=1 Tax=Candidatus Nitrososphaera gargensis TaxID=497727 RepID=UPI0011E58807|nr:hypothetical protein [Candidatus Nitrososphaera gargensis]
MTTPHHQLLLEELARAEDKQERMNVFRRYFAASRYNRLLIQQTLVRSAQDGSLLSKVKKMEQAHDKGFVDTVKALKKNGYFDEFLAAVKEEDEALVKIIEAYDKRMRSNMS